MSRLKRRRHRSLAIEKAWSTQLDEAVVGLGFVQGSRVAAITAAGTVWAVDGAAGIARRLGQHDNGGLTLTVQPAGAMIATGGQDGVIRLWDAVAGRSVATISTGAAWVERIAWRPDGTRFAAAVGKRVGVWDRGAEVVGFSSDHASTVADIVWQPDGGRIATAAYGGAAFLTVEGSGPTDHVALKGSSLLLAWQPQGRYLAMGNQDATVMFILIEEQETLQMWGFPARVRAMTWSDDGRWLATAAGSGVVLWDASGRGPKGRTPTLLEGHMKFVTTLAWQPKGPLVASGGDDAQICLFAPSRQVARRVPGDEGPPAIDAEDSIPLGAEATALAWSAGGGLLVAGDRSGTVSTFRMA
jgi:WD40 repeat protein